MKLLIGIVIGAAAGGYVVNNMSAEQRRKLEAQIDKAGSKIKNSPVTQTAKENAQQVASDASTAAQDKLNEAGDKASESMASSGSSATGTGTTATTGATTGSVGTTGTSRT